MNPGLKDARIRRCRDGKRCRKRPCPWCSYQAAKNDISSYADVAAHFDKCVSVTLTITGGESFADQWKKIRNVISHWFRLMKQHDSEYITLSYEVKDNDPWWHVHAHAVIFGNSVKGLGTAAIELWVEAAALAGVEADIKGQSFTTKYPPLAPKGTPDALSYVHKAKLHHGPGSLRETLIRAVQGDARALERFKEVELFLIGNPGLRWRRSTIRRQPSRTEDHVAGKTPERRVTYGTSDSKIGLAILLEALGVPKSLGSTMLTTNNTTVSESTVARARRPQRFRGFKAWKDAQLPEGLREKS